MRIHAALAIAVTVLAVGCNTAPGSTGDTDPAGLGDAVIQRQMADLYTAAQSSDENQVVVYGPGQEFYESAYGLFMRRYPTISVVAEPLLGEKLNTRLDQEFISGKHVGSVQIHGGSGTALAAGAGRCEQYRPFTAGYLTGTESAATYTAFSYFGVGIEYNSQKLTADQAPKGWRELADPEWKGRIALQDPNVVGVSALMISNLIAENKLDDTWVRELLGNEPLVVDTAALAEQSVARGERDVVAVNNTGVFTTSKKKGLPVEFVFPTEEGARLDTMYVCLLSGGPNPHAAKLFANWLFTPEAQDEIAQTGVYASRPGTSAPPHLPSLDTIQDKIIPQIPVGQQGSDVQNTIKMIKEIRG
ncbi:extracellular solute-binding protein [Mycolicibacterium septicum]|uniref:ABC transporter substrate-binding protein n=1 Tax=Mycolicibacterium septicum TaxID=98668 RepID=UPI0023E335E2|nr:extracellular solute-binding protein [Mycolicibacterium septicum]MDF3337114.1 extracellular solute-binding protein [Mycolicibacterium septicum]